MTIYSLYVKRHKTTGLKYLGYTSKDAHKYKGSGIYWLDHLAVHGDDVETTIIIQTQDMSVIKERGIYYSRLWDVVHARDSSGVKTWANLKEEDGVGGAMSADSLAKALAHENKPYKVRVTCLECRNEFGLPNFIRSHGAKCGTHVGSQTATKNPRFDHTVYTFINTTTGEVVRSTRYDFYTSRGFRKAQIGLLVNKRIDVAYGWVVR
jgi:hypothetical protein